ncbi:MAG: GTP-binding protein [Methanosarcinaceae archaeon]|nr:GTP-binding protein [Methanosarcinaceae archaeon]
MKCMIIGGFLGSGKTTTIRKLLETLEKQGKKTAIIVNEIGEIGIDGDTVSGNGVETRELTSGCICCSLRISLQETLKTLRKEHSPDIVIIEPTGIAFPAQIRDTISDMGLSDLAFAPIVTLVDASRLITEPEKLQNFMRNQIEDAELLAINKADLVDKERLLEIGVFLRRLNPKARMLHFSAREGGEEFEKFRGMLGDSGRENTAKKGAERNSITMSGVSAYSSEFKIGNREISPENAISISGQILENIRDEARKLNPEFTGHIKLSFTHQDARIKGSVTSAYESPEIEILKQTGKTGKPGSKRSKIKVLSALTDVPGEELAELVDAAVLGEFENRQLEIEKIKQTFRHTEMHNQGLPMKY